MSEEIEVKIRYKDLHLETSGNYDAVWRSVNEFFRKIRRELSPQARRVITVKDKDTSEVIVALRNNGFFDEPRVSGEVYTRFTELGKTDITPNAVQVQLKALSEEGQLVRREKAFFGMEGQGFAYLSPWENLGKYGRE